LDHLSLSTCLWHLSLKTKRILNQHPNVLVCGIY